MNKSKEKRPERTARIYYGAHPESREPLYWTVRIKDATKPVSLNGSLFDALKGEPGAVIGCHLSHCAMRNASQFPHPCKLASFTKTTALIVTKISGGRPSEAIRYRHSAGQLVDLNDYDIKKKVVQKHTHLAEKRFTLSPPQKARAVSLTPHLPARRSRRENEPARGVIHRQIPRGAVRRAIHAGLISRGLASVLREFDALAA